MMKSCGPASTKPGAGASGGVARRSARAPHAAPGTGAEPSRHRQRAGDEPFRRARAGIAAHQHQPAAQPRAEARPDRAGDGDGAAAHAPPFAGQRAAHVGAGGAGDLDAATGEAGRKAVARRSLNAQEAAAHARAGAHAHRPLDADFPRRKAGADAVEPRIPGDHQHARRALLTANRSPRGATPAPNGTCRAATSAAASASSASGPMPL